jgi:hypothetical protein
MYYYYYYYYYYSILKKESFTERNQRYCSIKLSQNHDITIVGSDRL